ncbi:MAG: alpha-glucosidase C-terminal domain-containing protein [Caldibacillus thermoamylovorans]|uniref:alpha-glucosidase C-terminal domain-containing protein n=1 Tax=Caldifermentibacillus hisashii TaxID=996558 RepID=UPI0030ECF097
MRKTYDIISNGDYRLLIEDDPNVFAYMRNWKNEHLLVISNFYGNMVDVSLPVGVVKNPTIIISNYRDSQTTWGELRLRPYESLVYYWET